jgi:hypothetical protein
MPFPSPSGFSQILYRPSTALKGEAGIKGVRKRPWEEWGHLTLFFLAHTPGFQQSKVTKNFSRYPRPM